MLDGLEPMMFRSSRGEVPFLCASGGRRCLLAPLPRASTSSGRPGRPAGRGAVHPARGAGGFSTSP